MDYKLAYGTLHTGKVDAGQHGRRFDVYAPDDGRQHFVESCFALGENDDSPRYGDFKAGAWHREYGFKCSCCFLGFNHTVRLHDHREGKLEVK